MTKLVLAFALAASAAACLLAVPVASAAGTDKETVTLEAAIEENKDAGNGFYAVRERFKVDPGPGFEPELAEDVEFVPCEAAMPTVAELEAQAKHIEGLQYVGYEVIDPLDEKERVVVVYSYADPEDAYSIEIGTEILAEQERMRQETGSTNPQVVFDDGEPAREAVVEGAAVAKEPAEGTEEAAPSEQVQPGVLEATGEHAASAAIEGPETEEGVAPATQRNAGDGMVRNAFYAGLAISSAIAVAAAVAVAATVKWRERRLDAEKAADETAGGSD